MRGSGSGVILFLVSVMAPGLYADLAPADFSAIRNSDTLAGDGAAVTSLSTIGPDRISSIPSEDQWAFLGHGDVQDQLATQTQVSISESSSAAPELREFPPLPDSAMLFLYAVGGLGAWQAGRSARKIHLGTMPEWYHSGGPAQINHARVWNPAFDMQVPHEFVTVEFPRTIGFYAQFEWVSNWDDPYLQLITAPRGPPIRI